MVKIVRRLITFVVVIGLLVVLGFGYLGFIPGVSAIFGSNQPVDLGLVATESDRLSANSKFQQTLFSADDKTGSVLNLIENGSTNQIDVALTPQEAAAHLMQIHPFTDLQIRFNADQTFEAAGKIDTPRIAKYLETLDLQTVQGIDVLKTVDRYLTGRPTIYVKGTGSITDDMSTLKLTQARLGRLPLSADQFAKGLKAYVDAVMEKVPGLDVQSLTVADTQAHFVGSVPSAVPQY